MPAARDVQDEVDAVKQRLANAVHRAYEERNASLRELVERHGLRQVDLVRLTGYSRETLRLILKVPHA